MHPGFVKLAVAITAEMGLRLCGVDLLLRTGSLADPPADYVVIEINAAPGLDNYAASGAVQAGRVDELYFGGAQGLEAALGVVAMEPGLSAFGDLILTWVPGIPGLSGDVRLGTIPSTAVRLQVRRLLACGPSHEWLERDAHLARAACGRAPFPQARRAAAAGRCLRRKEVRGRQANHPRGREGSRLIIYTPNDMSSSLPEPHGRHIAVSVEMRRAGLDLCGWSYA